MSGFLRLLNEAANEQFFCWNKFDVLSGRLDLPEYGILKGRAP